MGKINSQTGFAKEKDFYVQGNTVRQFNVLEALEEEPVRRLSHNARKNRDKAAHMNLGYVAFLTLAMCFASAVLIGYIKMQSENTAAVKRIATLESQLNDMRLDNDDEYSNIVGSVDLNKVREIAINELGMQYASEGQIVEVAGTSDDYVRQYSEMPK